MIGTKQLFSSKKYIREHFDHIADNYGKYRKKNSYYYSQIDANQAFSTRLSSVA